MMIVVVIFFAFVIRSLWGLHEYGAGFFTQPFYDPQTFSFGGVFRGTSIAVLTYIGFDGISAFSEEAENPRRNILLATVLVCVITGVLSALEVYAAQLVWGDKPFPTDMVESAYPARGTAGRRIFSVSSAEFHNSDREHRIGDGRATGSGAAALRHGAQRRIAARIFRRDRAEAANSDEQRPADRRHRAHGSILRQRTSAAWNC